MSLIRKIFTSLSARLMLMFLLVSITLTQVSLWALRDTIGTQVERAIYRDAAFFADVLIDRRTDLPHAERAEILAGSRNFDILLRRGDYEWSIGRHMHLEEVYFEPVPEEDLPVLVIQRSDKLVESLNLQSDWHAGRFFVKARARGNYDLVLAFSPDVSAQVQTWSTLLSVALLVVLFLGTQWLFRPLENIRNVVSRIGRGNLSARTNISRKDELGELGEQINEMADDIEGMLQAKRDLLLAISHELRTPVTRARVAVELLEDAQQKEALAADMLEMDRLISDLAEAESLSTRHTRLNRQPVSVSQLIETELIEHFPDQEIGRDTGTGDDYMLLDGMRIRLLIRNLLQNALRHTPQDKPAPSISGEVSDKGLNLVVQDSGEGIEAKHINRVTEAFYRPDASRQRKTGGFGLGLYLCRNIVSAHGGKMKIDSEPGVGTRVTITIPHRSDDPE